MYVWVGALAAAATSGAAFAGALVKVKADRVAAATSAAAERRRPAGGMPNMDGRLWSA
ncbi:hypothetical protein GCM10009687_61210 [Asanoa iriomotensis]